MPGWWLMCSISNSFLTKYRLKFWAHFLCNFLLFQCHFTSVAWNNLKIFYIYLFYICLSISPPVLVPLTWSNRWRLHCPHGLIFWRLIYPPLFVRLYLCHLGCAAMPLSSARLLRIATSMSMKSSHLDLLLAKMKIVLDRLVEGFFALLVIGWVNWFFNSWFRLNFAIIDWKKVCLFCRKKLCFKNSNSSFIY